mmetsp:Transcript_14534/g.41500  ORF Transcript_14534/g.41500 Transcript_14534/m.41500 type:complete len:241 (+) Transcript_14534:860-1582(+)
MGRSACQAFLQCQLFAAGEATNAREVQSLGGLVLEGTREDRAAGEVEGVARPHAARQRGVHGDVPLQRHPLAAAAPGVAAPARLGQDARADRVLPDAPRPESHRDPQLREGAAAVRDEHLALVVQPGVPSAAGRRQEREGGRVGCDHLQPLVRPGSPADADDQRAGTHLSQQEARPRPIQMRPPVEPCADQCGVPPDSQLKSAIGAVNASLRCALLECVPKATALHSKGSVTLNLTEEVP